MKASEEASTHAADLARLRGKIVAGGDLNPHLPRTAHEPFSGVKDDYAKSSDRDLLLADWGIHHLHLSSEMRANGRTARGDNVLFAAFRGNNAYLIGIYRHPKHANWAANDIFSVMVRNWPEAGLVSEFSGLGLVQGPNDDERLMLRNSGTTNLMEVDGKVYLPGGLGITSAGTPVEATSAADQVLRAIHAWRPDPLDRLRKVEGVPVGAYWRPVVHVESLGFEEYCGFAAGDGFVNVARII